MKRSELVKLVESLTGGTMVSVDIVTEPKCLKKHRETGELNPYSTILKAGSLTGNLGTDYKRSVETRMNKEGVEGDFKPEQRAWGELSSNRMLVYYKDQTYLQVIPLSATKPVYFADGVEVSKESIAGWLPKESEAPATQDMITNKVVVRDVKLCNVQRIRWFGRQDELTD
jgi:hypothetical protein